MWRGSIDIMQISGHKNVAFINNYSTLSEERHKKISIILSNTESETNRNTFQQTYLVKPPQILQPVALLMFRVEAIPMFLLTVPVQICQVKLVLCYTAWSSITNGVVTVCVFVRHLFSWYPFYCDFHSARIIFDVSSGFYLWNINNVKADICKKW